MENQDLFAAEMPSEKQPAQKKLVRRSAVTDDALAHFREPYSAADAARIGKEDIFYYIYGLLHSEEYRERYADNLSKQLPRIPRMKTYADFAAFSKAGRVLAALHLNYETVPMYQGVKFSGSLKGLKLAPQQIIGGADEDFRVVKMKFAKKDDKTKIVYNGKITVGNIPEAAYDYVVNGKSAIEWVGDGTPSRNHRQKIRYHQRCQRLGSRHHAQPTLSARTAPARHHRQLGNAENRLCFAEAGYCVI